MYKVIIADDETKTCQLIQMLGDWERLSLSVEAICCDGEEAWQAILEYRPDIVITDIRMPVYDGLQLIEKAKTNGLEIAFIVVSGYRHFEYAQNAIRFGVVDYLLKPIDQRQLNEVLEKTCRQIKSRRENERINGMAKEIIKNETKRKQLRLLQDVMDGKFSDGEKEISEEEIRRNYELDIREGGAFLAMLLNVERQELLSEGSLFLNKIDTLFRRSFQQCHYAITGRSRCGVWGVIYFDGQFQRYVDDAVIDFYYQVKNLEEIYGDFSPVLGVGTVEKQKECFLDSFRHAGIAEWQKMIYPNIKIHKYKPLEGKKRFEGTGLEEKLCTLSTAIELLQTDMVHEWFEGIRTIRGTEETIWSLHELRDRIIDVYRDCMKEFDLSTAEKLAVCLEEKSYRCKTLAELWDCLEGTIVESMMERAEKAAENDAKPIQNVKQYAKEHLGDTITLDDAARIAGFAPAYFSNVFKKQTGQTFTEYLIEERIQEAKRLLRTGKLSIGEISVRVGYADDKYFRKLFKKIVGIKASEYRKLYQ